MALLERVATLIKANINDLVDKAEHPEKLLKQLLLDMQNQFVQVKTQLAIAIADQHLLEKRRKENAASHQEWMQKAELAVSKELDDLAKTALERALAFETAAKNFSEQIADQTEQVETLREALYRLERKITETKSASELLIAKHRRARLAARTGTAAMQGRNTDDTLDRIRMRVGEAEAVGHGELSVHTPTPEQRFADLERNDQVERLLAGLKEKAAHGS
jgi:phage shock protein A